MSSIGAAPRAATETAASLAALLSPARAEASRRNGAKSRGPKTPEGKARSTQNALKHGLRAQKCVVLPGERASAFDALEAALMEELAPEGALETVLAQRVVAASWRLARAERIEAELFAREMHSPFGDRGLGLALIRDGNGARAFDTLLRYRGSTLAEFWRALRTLKALQAERAARSEPVAAAAPRLIPAPHAIPIEPETRGNPGDSGRPDNRAEPQADLGPTPARLPHRPLPAIGESASGVQPIEAGQLEQPAKAVPPSLPPEMVERGRSATALLAGTALVPPAAAAGPELVGSIPLREPKSVPTSAGAAMPGRGQGRGAAVVRILARGLGAVKGFSPADDRARGRFGRLEAPGLWLPFRQAAAAGTHRDGLLQPGRNGAGPRAAIGSI